MNALMFRPPQWITASDFTATDTSPMELSTLRAHVDACRGCRGRWFSLRCAAEALHDVVAPRFVTTLVLATVVLGLVVAVS